MTPVRVAVLASGGGTNLQALLDALASPTDAPARVVRVLTDRPAAGALDRARRAGVAAAAVPDPADADAVGAALDGADLVVLAGYLKLVPAPVVARFRWRMINIHPALLPAFGGPGMYGRRVHEAVIASGAALTGVTVHYVDEQYDRGPIIAQWPVPLRPADTADALAARVLAVEHRVLPAVVLALAHRGLPAQPIRLFAKTPAFGCLDQPSVELADA